MVLKRHLPLPQVTLIVSLKWVLDLREAAVLSDLGLDVKEFITEPHRPQSDGDPELLAQALGRIAASLKMEAMIVPAAPEPSRHNIVIYRPNLDPGSDLDIHGSTFLPPHA